MSSVMRRLSLALGLLVVAVMALSVFGAPNSAFAAALPAGIPAAGSPVTVKEVTSGDQVTVNLGNGTTAQVLLAGINAPDQGECYFDQSKSNLANLLPVGTVVYLEESGSVDSTGDYVVRYLWLPGTDGGKAKLINTKLVREGDAGFDNSLDTPKYFSNLQEAQDSAQNKGMGMWSACGDQTGSLNVITSNDAYLDWFTNEMNGITTSMATLGTLMANFTGAEIYDQTWLSNMSTVTTAWISAHDAALTTTPPESYDSLHTLWIKSMAHFANAADMLDTGLANGDATSISAAVDEINLGQQLMLLSSAVLTQVLVTQS